MNTPAPHTPDAPRDLVGIGIGPFNLSLAALADPLTGLDAVFYDQRPGFRWHPGLLIDGARVQVPFLADLVTLVDPASPWTFLNHLRARERLFPFYFAERFHIERAEYDAYCRWVAENLPALRFHHQVDAVRWNPERDLFEVDYTQLDAGGEAEALGRTHTRNVVLGIGTEPHVPDPLRPLVEDPAVPVVHAADYLRHRDTLLAAGHVTVIGTGQSGAEVFLDLLRHRPAGRERLHWLGRTGALAPMEYSKLGLEHFTPDYTRYFHGLAEPVRDRLVAAQWQLHKGIDADTTAAIHDELYRRTLDGGWPDTTLTPLPELGPHPAPVDDLGHGVHVEVAVREGRDARADHLGAGQPGAQHHVPPGEVGLDGPDDVVEPLLGGQVLGESAQRDHGRVRVAVDQPGEGDLAACVDAVGGGHRGPCRGGGHGVDDSAAYDDGRVLLEADPPTVVVHEDGAAADDEIGGPGVPGVSGGPGGLG